jgi:hypothetical protein
MASNPLLKFKEEILKEVVLPKLEGLLYKEKGDLSVSELWKLFRDTHDCTVSLREFKEWCNDLNLRPQQTTVWNLPQRKPTSTRTETIFTGQGGLDKYENYTPTDEDIDEVLFDNET